MSNEKLTDSQLELKKRIEEKTAAKVHFEPRFSAEEQFTARIVWEHLFTDEDGDLAKELIELSFIADRPRKKPMTEAQLSAYPPELQNCFRTLFPDESCNVLPAASIADTPEKALEKLQGMAGLLDFGWHLGEEANFSDPFRPHYGKNREVVAVYGGSFRPSAPAWIDAVRDFGRFLAAHGMTLLYGGCRGGARQLLADTVLENGGEVIGIVPATLLREQRYLRLTETVIAVNRAEQETEMRRRADVIVALPGSFDACGELFHALALRGTGMDPCCPVGLLNVDGCFDDLLHFIGRSVEVGFMTRDEAERLKSGRSAQELFEQFTIGNKRK